MELIHSDLCDFHATHSLRNKKNVITFIDDATRFCYVYLWHAKDEALNKFKIYKTEVELQQNDLTKTLSMDRGGLYCDPSYFQSIGIIQETKNCIHHNKIVCLKGKIKLLNRWLIPCFLARVWVKDFGAKPCWGLVIF